MPGKSYPYPLSCLDALLDSLTVTQATELSASVTNNFCFLQNLRRKWLTLSFLFFFLTTSPLL